MIIVIGEILIDRFPEYERVGGAPFNFAFHLKNLGWPVRLITRIGEDDEGRSISRMLEDKGFNLDDVQIDRNHATGTVEVTLDDHGIPEFDIRENVAYDHIDLTSVLDDKGGAIDMIYFGTLVQRTAAGHQQVRDFLTRHGQSTTCFCDINLRPPHVNAVAIEPSLYYADLLKLNDEELASISSMCNGPERTQDAINWLMQKYQISKLALTHGAKGSALVAKDRSINSPPAKAVKIIDTVGAGDAYAAVIAAGTLKNQPMEHALSSATDFAARICGIPGAIPDNELFYTALKNDFERIPNAQ